MIVQNPYPLNFQEFSFIIPDSRHPQNFAEQFLDIFEFSIADTPELKQRAHKLRYQVYCEERSYESKDTQFHEQEIDIYDAHAIQGILVHKPTGIAIGACRVIMPNPDNIEESFPIQKVSSDISKVGHSKLLSACEVSRFCVSMEARKMICNPLYYSLDNEETRRTIAITRRLLPYMCIGLIRLINELNLKNRRTNFYALLDPRLLKGLMLQSICPISVGEMVDYNGMRFPTLFSQHAMFELTYRMNKEIWKVISDNGRLHEIALKANI